MGNHESTLSGIQGFQISRVLPNSPAHLCGLVPFFDIITAVDRTVLLDEVPEFFKLYVKQKKGQEITLTVYNLRIRAYREIPFVPTDEWGGQGLLGCSIDWSSSADGCLESTWHIVDILPQTAAASADLVPQRDYIIGMQAPDEQVVTMLRRPDDFHSRLDTWRSLRATNTPGIPPSLLLLIFDSIDNAVKEVLVEMGSCTSIGVDVANGYLHLVPATPGSTKLPVLRKFFVASHHHHHHRHQPPQAVAEQPAVGADVAALKSNGAPVTPAAAPAQSAGLPQPQAPPLSAAPLPATAAGPPPSIAALFPPPPPRQAEQPVPTAAAPGPASAAPAAAALAAVPQRPPVMAGFPMFPPMPKPEL